MDDQVASLQKAQPSASTGNTGVLAPVEGSSKRSQAPNEHLDCISIKTEQELEDRVSDFISREFPNAPELLLARLKNSILQRKSRLLKLRQQGKSTKSTGFQAQHPCTLHAERMASHSSTESLNWMIDENFPKPPEIETPQLHFRCPICFFPSPSREAVGDLWISHVTHDLQPFICLLENCQSPHTAFGSFEEWNQHAEDERQCPASDASVTCPLCLYRPNEEGTGASSSAMEQENLQRHMARHLQALALTFLPPPESKCEPVFVPSASQPRMPPNYLPIPLPGLPPPYRHPAYHNLTMTPPMHSRETLPASFYTSEDLYTSQPKERMITCIPTNAHDQPPPPPPTTPKTESYTILIADDNNVNQRIFKKMLSKHRHVTVSAYNGEEAFCAVQKRKYDVVLMDISMPVMDGIEATLQIRAHERRMRITRTPIIALTVRTMDAGEHPVFQSEIDDYLCKPIRMPELYEKVRRFGWMGRQAEEGEMQEVLDAIGKGGVRGERPEVWAKL